MIRALIVILILSSSLFANEYETFLIKGNEAYKNNDYKSAIHYYTKVLTSGLEGASVLYNLGNAHYRLGNIGKAIFYYEKALKLKPGDEDINHNLQIAKLQTVDKLDELPKLFFVRWWESILSVFSVDGWTLVSYLLYLLVLVIISLMMLIKNGKLQRILYKLVFPLSIFLILSVIILVIRFKQEASQSLGVVLESVVTAKTSPDKSGVDAFVIHEGLKFEIEDEVDEWLKIRLADGKIGWIPKEVVGII